MKDGFVRVGSAAPEIRVADVDYNVAQIIRLCSEADLKKCSLIVFPELSITGYTCGDLFLQDELIESALRGLYDIVEASSDLNLAIVVGLPLKLEGKLYNVAAVVAKGEVIGYVPKSSTRSVTSCLMRAKRRQRTEYRSVTSYSEMRHMMILRSA